MCLTCVLGFLALETRAIRNATCEDENVTNDLDAPCVGADGEVGAGGVKAQLEVLSR